MMFSLEWECEGYETYWDLDWVGESLEKALENQKYTLEKYGHVYNRSKITEWVNGVQKRYWFYTGGVEE